MTTSSIRILFQIDWPGATTDRLWDGSGPMVDALGNVWRGCTLVEGIDIIEQAMNGEAVTLNASLMGVSAEIADLSWLSSTNNEIIGAVVKIMIQPCDEWDQPEGDAEIKFIGPIDNMIFSDTVTDKGPVSVLTVECTNRFTLRRLTNGAVLSDADQRARSAILNPLAPPDRFCERVPLMLDKTIVWPRF